ncbi:MAG: hypothetical protein RJB66_2166 [Pseudomonadota bacterium]
MIKKIKETILHPQKPYWVLISLFFMGLALMVAQEKSLPKPKGGSASITSVDTYIPSGHVLVTLQLINSESIDGLIGDYGLVDLYEAVATSSEESKKRAKPLARRLKIIRAPNNPALFGVLIKETETQIIQKLSAPVFAVIQDPASEDLMPRTPPKKEGNTRLIHYGEAL